LDSKGKIAPSLLACDFAHFAEEIEKCEKAGADLFHVDVMDGHFVPNITMGPVMVEAARRSTTLPLDVHLMIENPEKYIEAFVKAGATSVSVHVETCQDLGATLTLIEKHGAIPGIAINPETEAEKLAPFIEQAQFILVMSVHPGFGGQKFIETSYDKIKAVANVAAEKNTKINIAVDGGVDASNVKKLFEAGAHTFIAGSFIFKTDDYAATIKSMRSQL